MRKKQKHKTHWSQKFCGAMLITLFVVVAFLLLSDDCWGATLGVTETSDHGCAAQALRSTVCKITSDATYTLDSIYAYVRSGAGADTTTSLTGLLLTDDGGEPSECIEAITINANSGYENSYTWTWAGGAATHNVTLTSGTYYLGWMPTEAWAIDTAAQSSSGDFYKDQSYNVLDSGSTWSTGTDSVGANLFTGYIVVTAVGGTSKIIYIGEVYEKDYFYAHFETITGIREND